MSLIFLLFDAQFSFSIFLSNFTSCFSVYPLSLSLSLSLLLFRLNSRLIILLFSYLALSSARFFSTKLHVISLSPSQSSMSFLYFTFFTSPLFPPLFYASSWVTIDFRPSFAFLVIFLFRPGAGLKTLTIRDPRRSGRWETSIILYRMKTAGQPCSACSNTKITLLVIFRPRWNGPGFTVGSPRGW